MNRVCCPRKNWYGLTLAATMLYALLAPGTGFAQSTSVTDVRIGRPGDRWLDLQQYQRIERATRDKQFGYAVTYHIAGDGELQFFWPRSSIDFANASPKALQLSMELHDGRLLYPALVTATSLPDVHKGILLIESMYTADAQGGIKAMRGFVLVLSLTTMTPTMRTIPAGAGPTVVRLPTDAARSSTAPTITKTAPKAPASKTPASKTVARKTSAVTAHTTVVVKTVAPSPRALARALEKAGHVRPSGTAAHHIVAGSAKDARASRIILRRLGIGINDASNGVFLPATKALVNPTGASVHSTLHTKTYYMRVNKLLEGVTTRVQAEVILERIRQLLLKGDF